MANKGYEHPRVPGGMHGGPYASRMRRAAALMAGKHSTVRELAIGTNEPDSALHVMREGSGAHLIVERVQTSKNSGGVTGRKARGTELAKTAAQDEDNILVIQGYAYAGSTNEYVEGARIEFEVDDAVSDSGTGAVPSRINFRTMNSGGTLNQVARIDKDGNLGIGTTAPIAKLDVAGYVAITSEMTTPASPGDGKGYLYSKAGGRLYWRSGDLAETDLTTDLNTTYSISCVDGDNIDEEKIRLTAGGSGSGTDDVVLEAGTGLTIARSGDKITFTNSETDTNTTYAISCEDGDNTDEEKIRLTAGGSGSGTDDVVLEAGTGLSIARSGDKITFTNSETDTNTTYAISVQAGDNTDEEKIRLTAGGSGSGTDDVVLEAGTGLSIASSGDKITYTNTVSDTNTTYAISVEAGDNTDEEKIRLTAGGSGSGTDDVVLEAGTGLSIASSGDKITYTNTVSDTNTTYAISVEAGDNTDEEKIRLTAGGSGSGTDDVVLEAGTGLSIASAGDKITYTNTVSDTNTTYAISVEDGDNTDEEKIRLTAGGSGSGTDDIVLEAGTGLSITRAGDKITYTNTATGGSDTNTTYTISCEDGDNTDEEKIRLTAGGSGSGTDDVVLEAGTGLSVARSGDKITFTNTVGGVSWDGSTANGVATFKDSDEATVESNLTFDGSTLTVAGNVFVDGGADANQVKIQCYSSQSNSPFLLEQSDGTDVFELTNTGKVICASGAEFKGNSFKMGSSGGSTNFIHATGANNLNFRNTTASKALQFDYPASNGDFKIRTHDGSSTTVERFTYDANGKAVHNPTGVSTSDMQFQGDTDTDLFYLDASSDRVGISTAGPRATLDIRGGLCYEFQTKTSDYTLTASDHVLTVSAAGGNVTITLPAWIKGRVFEIYRKDSNMATQVIVTRDGSDTINAGTSVAIAQQWSGLRIIGADSTTWIATTLAAASAS